MASESEDPIGARLKWAIEIAREAGDGTLKYFRRGDVVVERKQDDSPVTVADRTAEELLRERIGQRFPKDSILGEEFGSAEGSSGFQWVVDPIDGTKSFIHGVPLYTTLVAVVQDGISRLGVIHAPAANETVYASVGGGCWYVQNDPLKPSPARVSRVSKLRECLLVTTDLHSYYTERPSDSMPTFLRLERSVRLARTWGDGYGYLMVATGRAEVMLDPAINLWDVAAIQPIIEEAGGQFLDWQGRASVHSADAFATNGLVTEEVLAILRG